MLTLLGLAPLPLLPRLTHLLVKESPTNTRAKAYTHASIPPLWHYEEIFGMQCLFAKTMDHRTRKTDTNRSEYRDFRAKLAKKIPVSIERNSSCSTNRGHTHRRTSKFLVSRVPACIVIHIIFFRVVSYRGIKNF